LVAQLDQGQAVDAEIIGEATLHYERVLRVQLELIEQRPDVS
jgi:hypothetical protein